MSLIDGIDSPGEFVPLAGQISGPSPYSKLVLDDTGRLTRLKPVPGGWVSNAVQLGGGDSSFFGSIDEAISMGDNSTYALIADTGAQYRRAADDAEYNSWPTLLKFQNVVGTKYVFFGTSVSMEHAGALNSGTQSALATADDDAYDACYAWCMLQPNGGTIRFLPGLGYRLNRAHSCHPTKPLRLYFEKAAFIYCGLTGADSVLFKASHPTAPGDSSAARGEGLTLHDVNIRFPSSITTDQIGAVFFEWRYVSSFFLTGEACHLSHYRNNTIMRLSGCYNCDLGMVNLFGGGYRKAYKETLVDTHTFSIGSGSQTLTSNVPFFDAGMVGRPITISNQQFRITAFTNSQTVTVTPPSPSAYTALPALTDGVKGAITNGSAVVTVERACMTASDVGRSVVVVGGRNSVEHGTKSLYAKILSVAPDGLSFTMSRNSEATNAATYIVFSPTLEIYSETDANTNDHYHRQILIRNKAGTNLYIENGIGVYLEGVKLHAENEGVNHNQGSDFCAIISNMSGTMRDLILHGTCTNGLGRILYDGGSHVYELEGITCSSVGGQPVVHVQGCTESGGAKIGMLMMDSTIPADQQRELFAVDGLGVLQVDGPVVVYRQPPNYPQVRGRPIDPTLMPELLHYLGAHDSGAAMLLAATTGIPEYAFFRSNGTLSAPTANNSAQELGRHVWYGYTPSGVRTDVARIRGHASSPSGSIVAGEIRIGTRNTAGVFGDRWRVSPTGNFIAEDDNAYDIASSGTRVKTIFSYRLNTGELKLLGAQAVPANDATAGTFFIDVADNSLKFKFPNNTVKTIATNV